MDNFNLHEKIWWTEDLKRQIINEGGTISFMTHKSVNILWNAPCGSRGYSISSMNRMTFLSFGDPKYE